MVVLFVIRVVNKLDFRCRLFVVLSTSTVLFGIIWIIITSVEESSKISNNQKVDYKVEIQSQCPLGDYLWKHIMEGKTEECSSDGITWTGVGRKSVGVLDFTYFSGNDYKVSADTSLLVLIADGSTPEKQTRLENWLESYLSNLRTLVLVVHGRSNCENYWITPYLNSTGGPVKAAFVVFANTLVASNVNDIYPWPLGVATHLEFPLFSAGDVELLAPRTFVCNLFASEAGSNMSEEVARSLGTDQLRDVCFVKTAKGSGDFDSRYEYIQILSDSDLTICLKSEAGNVETHCIYEALSLGSIPVVEDDLSCGSSGLAFLKQHKAPFILVETMHQEISRIVASEQMMSLQEKIARRATAVNWYAKFRQGMALQFVNVIRSLLEGENGAY